MMFGLQSIHFLLTLSFTRVCTGVLSHFSGYMKWDRMEKERKTENVNLGKVSLSLYTVEVEEFLQALKPHSWIMLSIPVVATINSHWEPYEQFKTQLFPCITSK